MKFITSRVSGRGHKDGASCGCVSVCLSVCQCANAPMAEAIDVWSQNLVQGLTFVTSWTSLMVKVKGQGHQVEKGNFGLGFLSCN